jgi:hypothetical protein
MEYQAAGTNAQLRLSSLLQAQGVPTAEADDLMAALETGAIAGAQSEVVELDGMAPASRVARFTDGGERGPGGHRSPGLGTAWRPACRGC